MLSDIEGDCVNVSGVSTNVIDGIKMVTITVSLNCTSTASMTVPVEVNVTDSNVGRFNGGVPKWFANRS